MSLTAFRGALKTQLAAALSITFVDGKVEGPVEGADLGCIFPAREFEDARDVVVSHYAVAVRVFKAFVTPVSPQVPNHDPAALEALATTLKTSIRAAQTGVGGTWFHRVITVEYDMDANGFEAVIVSTQDNEAT